MFLEQTGLVTNEVVNKVTADLGPLTLSLQWCENEKEKHVCNTKQVSGVLLRFPPSIPLF